MKLDTYTAVKNRLLQLLEIKGMSIHKLAIESAVAPSTIKNILYGKSQNPKLITIKMICDGLGITLLARVCADPCISCLSWRLM